MIAEAGLAALWLAAALGAMQFALAAIGVRRVLAAPDDESVLTAELIGAVRPVAIVQGALAALAMALLIAVFMRSDMSVLLVAENSHSEKPLLYKFAGAWG